MDPDHFGKLDPDSHQNEKPDPDLHQSQKPDPDPHHQSQTSGAMEVQNGAMELRAVDDHNGG
jgi:hypothetical protein